MFRRHIISANCHGNIDWGIVMQQGENENPDQDKNVSNFDLAFKEFIDEIGNSFNAMIEIVKSFCFNLTCTKNFMRNY